MTEQPKGKPLELDSPLLVNWEYASEERLAIRNKTYRELAEGANAEEMVFEAVRESGPKRLLEAGSGTGELAARVQNELGADVVALDVSPRMVKLTGERGVESRLGDVQELRFGDDEFDCAVAAWGEAALRKHFAEVERRDAQGTVVFPDRESMRRFVTATITRAHLSDKVPPITEPFRSRTSHVVFVARKAQ